MWYDVKCTNRRSLPTRRPSDLALHRGRPGSDLRRARHPGPGPQVRDDLDGIEEDDPGGWLRRSGHPAVPGALRPQPRAGAGRAEPGTGPGGGGEIGRASCRERVGVRVVAGGVADETTQTVTLY